MFKRNISLPIWFCLLIVCLMPLYVALANTAYRKLAITVSTIDSTPIGAVTPSTGAFTTLSSTGNTTVTGKLGITGGVIATGTGLKHQRFNGTCVTPAAVNATCTSTYTWTNPFADANYTVLCWGRDPTNGTGTISEQAGSRTATSFNILITSNGLANSYAGLNCVGFHD